MSERLTAWQAVRQSHAIHPDWDVETHLVYLEQEGYDLSALSIHHKNWKAPTIVRRWLAEMAVLPIDVAAERYEQDRAHVVRDLRAAAERIANREVGVNLRDMKPGYVDNATFAIAEVSAMMANLGLSDLVRSARDADRAARA